MTQQQPLGKPHFCNHQARTVGTVKVIDFLCHVICEPFPTSAVPYNTNLSKGIWRDLKDLNSFILTGSLGSGNIVPWGTLEQAFKMPTGCVTAILAPVECSEPGLC